MPSNIFLSYITTCHQMTLSETLAELYQFGEKSNIYITDSVLEQVEYDDLFVIIYLVEKYRCRVVWDQNISIYGIKITPPEGDEDIGFLFRGDDGRMCGGFDPTIVSIDQQTDKVDIIIYLAILAYGDNIHFKYKNSDYCLTDQYEFLSGLVKYRLAKTQTATILFRFIKNDKNLEKSGEIIGQYLGIIGPKSAKKIC